MRLRQPTWRSQSGRTGGSAPCWAFWVWQYRSTRQKAALYPVDQFGGFTTELAGPATFFFIFFTVVVTAFAVALIVGHLVWGQKF